MANKRRDLGLKRESGWGTPVDHAPKDLEVIGPAGRLSL